MIDINLANRLVQRLATDKVFYDKYKTLITPMVLDSDCHQWAVRKVLEHGDIPGVNDWAIWAEREKDSNKVLYAGIDAHLTHTLTGEHGISDIMLDKEIMNIITKQRFDNGITRILDLRERDEWEKARDIMRTLAEPVTAEGNERQTTKYVSLASVANNPSLLTPPEPLNWTGWRGKLSLFFSREKMGKSWFIASDIVEQSNKGRKILFFYEETFTEVHKRFMELGANMDNIIMPDFPPTSWAEAERGFIEGKPDIAYIDTLTRFFTDINQTQPKPSDEGEWDKVISRIQRWARMYDCAITIVDHSKKDGLEYRGSTEKGGAVDIIIPFNVEKDIATLNYKGRVQGAARTFQWLGHKKAYQEITDKDRKILSLNDTERKTYRAIHDLYDSGQPTTLTSICKLADTDKGNTSRALIALTVTGLVYKSNSSDDYLPSKY